MNRGYEKESAEQWREKAADLCCPRGTRIQSGGAQATRRESKARTVASRLAEWGTTRLVERHQGDGRIYVRAEARTRREPRTAAEKL